MQFKKQSTPKHFVYVTPTNHDVRCGRGARNFQHPGNQFLRTLIEAQTIAYGKCVQRADKTDIIHGIIQNIYQHGGRFLKFDAASNKWYDGGIAAGKSRVGIAFRDAAKLLRESQQSAATVQKAPVPFNALRSRHSNTRASERKEQKALKCKQKIQHRACPMPSSCASSMPPLVRKNSICSSALSKLSSITAVEQFEFLKSLPESDLSLLESKLVEQRCNEMGNSEALLNDADIFDPFSTVDTNDDEDTTDEDLDLMDHVLGALACCDKSKSTTSVAVPSPCVSMPPPSPDDSEEQSDDQLSELLSENKKDHNDEVMPTTKNNNNLDAVRWSITSTDSSCWRFMDGMVADDGFWEESIVR